MSRFSWTGWSKTLATRSLLAKRRQRQPLRRTLLVERLDERAVLSSLAGAPSPGELVNTGFTATALAQALVGEGVTVSNATFTGNAAQNGSFTFSDPTVVGFGQGIILSSGNAADVVGPNVADYTSSTFPPEGDIWGAGDQDLDHLAGFPTYDAAVLEFDFVPTANQVVFQYAFASDEYPEWVNTPFNDVFAFYVGDTSYATVRQEAGNPNSPFVPVAVNNLNNGNPDYYPEFVPQRPDLFRANYVDPNGGASVIDLELDGITHVLTFQAPVTPGVKTHMKLAIADASDGIYDSAVFIQAGSLVSNKSPVADLSLLPETGQAPLTVTAVVEGEDPDGLPLTYTIDWGDGTASSGPLNSPADDAEKTATVDHTYTASGEYIVTLTVSNGTLSSTSTEDVDVLGVGGVPLDTFIVSKPSDPSSDLTPSFTFSSNKAGSTYEYSLDGAAFIACPSNLTFLGGLAEGPHAIVVQAANSGLTDATPASYSWTIDTSIGDTTAPDLTIVTKPANPSNDSTPTFTFFSTDPEAEFEWNLDLPDPLEDIIDWEGSDPVLVLTDKVPELIDGTYIIEVQARDNFGNVSEPLSYTWTLDTVAPVTTITNWPAGNDNTPVFKFAASEANVIFTYSIDGGAFVPGKSGLPLPALSDGSHTFAVKATDAAGNVGESVSYAWEIDAITLAAPAVALANDSGLPGDNITNDGALNVTAEPAAIIEFSIDSGATWTSAFAAKEGPNTVFVRQTVGGDVSGPATLSFMLDTAAPAAPGVALANDTGSSFVDGITSDGAVNVTAEFGANVEYSIDSGAAWSNTFSAMEGPNTIQVRQTDLAGNASDMAVLDFTLDTAAPSAPGVALLHDTGSSSLDNITNDGALSVNAEPQANVEYSTNSGATWASAFSASEGAAAVQVRQTDLAGNVSSAAALSFTLDTTPPQLNPTFSSPSPFLVGAQGITVSPNATDAWGVASQSAGTVDTSSAGQKSVTCSATDVAGNTAAVSVPYSVIPSQAPRYGVVSLLPAYVIPKQITTIPVLFQLRDANNRLISDQQAAKLLPGISITLDGVPIGKVQYHKTLNLFSATLKVGKLAKGLHNLAIHVAVDGTEVATLNISVKVI